MQKNPRCFKEYGMMSSSKNSPHMLFKLLNNEVEKSESMKKSTYDKKTDIKHFDKKYTSLKSFPGQRERF